MALNRSAKKKWWFLVSLVILSGCTTMCGRSHKDMEAGQVVEAYLEQAFNIRSVDDVEKLMIYTSGNLKQALEEADATTIDEVFVKKRYEVKNFSFLEQKHLTPREREITYELEYKELNSKNIEEGAQYTIENSLNLIRKQGAWYITDVIGGQTAIDFIMADEVTRSGVTTGGGGDVGLPGEEEPPIMIDSDQEGTPEAAADSPGGEEKTPNPPSVPEL